MIIRIVRMTFRDEGVSEFLDIFNSSRDKIRNFDGCSHLELFQDADMHNVYTTYSYWESKEHLNAYRSSELFKNVWSGTKALFSERAQAHSYLRSK